MRCWAMRIITSFSPKRIDHQQFCLQSWLDRGCEVTAVQTAAEAEAVQQSFPNARVVVTDKVADAFGKPHHVRIAALMDQCKSESGLILNSDIHMLSTQEQLQRDWQPDGRLFKIGIRWEQHPRTGEARLLKYGIDAFLITPEIAEKTPDIGMGLGIPVWDYWLPYHVVHRLGKRLVTKKTDGLRHVAHVQNWQNSESDTGFAIVKQHYGISQKALTQWIQRATGRTLVKYWQISDL